MLDSTRERETTVRRPWRLVLVASFLAFLAIQGLISFKIRPEPYPMIRMPSFGLAASADGTYPVTFVSGSVDFEDGTTADIDPYAVMSTLRFSTARPRSTTCSRPRRARTSRLTSKSGSARASRTSPDVTMSQICASAGRM